MTPVEQEEREMTGTANSFVWYELMTSDLKAAEAFYAGVVGWTAQDSGMPGVSYTILSMGGDRVAGAMTLPQDAREAGGRPGWLGYIGVDNTDAAAERLSAAGGRVLKAPSDIPGVGRFAVVADPGGATFCLFGGVGEAPDPPVMAPGRIGWHELYAGDGPSAFAFYADQFGWVEDRALDMGPMGTYRLFRIPGHAGDMAVGGMMTKPPQVPVPHWGFYFTVPEIEAAAERVKGGGGQVVNGPMEVPGGAWIIQCVDPQGAHFALVAPPETVS